MTVAEIILQTKVLILPVMDHLVLMMRVFSKKKFQVGAKNFFTLKVFLFCLFNIGFNISNLNNQLLFAIQNSKFRVFGDFIIVGIISLYSLFLFIQKITFNLNNAIILLVMSVWFVFLFNYFIKKKFDLFDVLKVNNT
jgi:hypothetical protein